MFVVRMQPRAAAPRKPRFKNAYGSLEVADGTTFLNAQPAFVVETQRDKEGIRPFLYRTPPRDRSDQLLTILDALEEKQEVLARPLVENLHTNPHIYEVTTFKKLTKADSERPDISNGIEIKTTGFMFADNLTIVNESLQRFNRPIFHEPPTAKHIKQGQMGDCYLLAPLLAIVQKDPNFIIGMMRQLKNFTIVRLFHPETMKPMFLSVPNLKYKIKNQDASYHLAEWVRVIEAAFAAAGFVKKQNEGEAAPHFAVGHGSYRFMYGVGGDSGLALNMLTGHSSVTAQILQEDTLPFSAEDCYAAKQFAETKKFRDEESNPPRISHYLSAGDITKLGKYFQDRPLELLQFTTWREQLPAKITSREFLLQAEKIVTDEAIKTIFRKVYANRDNGFPDNQGRMIYLISNPHEGHYNQNEHDLYDELQQQLAEGNLITADTHYNIEKDLTGIVKSHCYQVVNVFRTRECLTFNDDSFTQSLGT